MEMAGGCLCGAVRFMAEVAKPSVVACHCDMCRRWTGGPYFSVDCGGRVKFEGEDHVEVVETSDWAERGFCAKCGSGLFYRVKGSGQHQMAAGTFDDQSGFSLRLQVFTDEAQGYCALADETKMMTGEEIRALYAPKAGKGG